MIGRRQAMSHSEPTVKQTACGTNACAQLPIQEENKKQFQ